MIVKSCKEKQIKETIKKGDITDKFIERKEGKKERRKEGKWERKGGKDMRDR